MNVFLPQDRLAAIFDQVIRETVWDEAGMMLRASDREPDGELCTVYAVFERGYQTSLSFCAEASLFVRLTKRMLQTETVGRQDVENYAKEYFNILCGRIATQIFQITKVPARFSVPVFCRGRFVPDGCAEQIVLDYISGENEGVRLTHYTLSAAFTEQTRQNCRKKEVL